MADFFNFKFKSLNSFEVPINLKIKHLTKIKVFPWHEWRGETKDKYLIIRFFNGVFSYGLDEREIKAEIENVPILSNINDIHELLKSLNWKITSNNYIELM